jgi:hypothetical protein
MCSSLFFGVDMEPDTSINLGKAFKEWCMFMMPSKQNNKNLNISIFEATREEFAEDVEIVENKKPKETKEDPRLALMRKRKSEAV